MNFFVFCVISSFVTICLFVCAGGGISKVFGWILGEDPLVVVCYWALGFILSSFVCGFITHDYSWVDRLWSTLPCFFSLYYCFRATFSIPIFITNLLVFVWGIRLSYNFWRKGGYSGEEDYRWRIIRGKMNNAFFWQLFNLSFISFFQISLFVCFTYPIYAMINKSEVNLFFVLSLILGIFLIIFESIADNQQWNFQQQKKLKTIVTEDTKRGFLTQGLFAYSRHPNYFGEISFWWAVWLMSFSLNPSLIKTGIFGPILVTIIISSSTILTEAISSEKYPEYKEYQKLVARIIPWFAKKLKTQ